MIKFKKMSITQKIYVDKSKTNYARVVGRDNTGPWTKTNPEGYGGNNGSPIETIIKYIFTVEDKVGSAKYTRIFGTGEEDVKNPPVPRIGYREDFEVYPDNLQRKFPDSLYVLKSTAMMEYEFEGTGIKGQDFLINVPGTDAIREYNVIITPTLQVYKISSIVGTDTQTPIVFLDRVLEESFETFNVGLSSISEPFMINNELEDCLSSKIASYLCEGDCSGPVDSNISKLRILYWGLQHYMEKGDYLQASVVMKKCKELCLLLKCKCNGC